jgi:hypothetical protein
MMCNKSELGKHGGIKYHEIRNRYLLAFFMYFDVSPYIAIKPYTISV